LLGLGNQVAQSEEDDTMLGRYFRARKTLERLRSGPSGQYIDGFAAALERDGYSHLSAIRYLRVAAHLGYFLERQGKALTDLDSTTPQAFFRHLPTCCCPLSNGGKRSHHLYFGAKRYCNYLLQIGVCHSTPVADVRNPEPEVVTSFRRWLKKHRGATEPTAKQYCRAATDAMIALGDDPSRWDAKGVRAYFLERAGRCGPGTVEKLITSLRIFLRHLGVQGQCQADLDKAVPAFASWRLAELPRYLAAEQVDRLIAACNGSSARQRRDRAILLLLARLGLRAGDVARLRFVDIEWQTGTLRVSGKGRYQVRLPLPQEVGDAIIDYLACRPAVRGSDHVFVRNIAPFRPFLCGDGVSNVVRRAMKRAGVTSPAKGAHVLRHTAATEMLRQGVPLDRIALVLRHRGIDTTAYYAKADVGALKQIAQPWPEVLS
jgi:site-specific recombinase XerD